MLTGLSDDLGYLNPPLWNSALVGSHLPMLGQVCIQLVLTRGLQLIVMSLLGKERSLTSVSKGDP